MPIPTLKKKRKPKKSKIVENKLAKPKDDLTTLKDNVQSFLPRLVPQIMLFILTLLAFPGTERFYWDNIETGMLWRQKDLIAPFDFPVYKSEITLNQERSNIENSIIPVFDQKIPTPSDFLQNLNGLESNLKELETAYQKKQSVNTPQFKKLAQQTGFPLTENEWAKLFETHRQTNQKNYEFILSNLPKLETNLFTENIIDLPKSQIKGDKISIINPNSPYETLFPVEKLLTIDDIEKTIQQRLSVYLNDPPLSKIGAILTKNTFPTTLRYNLSITQQRRNDALNSISKTRGLVRQGQVIVLKGDKITPEIKAQLLSYQIASNQQGALPWWRVRLGEMILSLCVLTILFLFLFILRRPIYENIRHIWMVCILLGVDVILFGIGARFNLPYLMLPVTTISILLTLGFDSRVGFFGTISAALLGGLIFGYDFKLTFLVIFSGLVSVFSVRVIQNRLQFFITPAWVFLSLFLGWTGISLMETTEWEPYFMGVLYILLNAIFLLLVYPLTGVMERFFDITTELTLLELSDTNRPLLKELSQQAPGTFSHSLQVANLVEAATQAVGGNVLLARVGALYHDIGKMAKPEFYIENQRGGENPLDSLTPRMCARVISNHVKEGLEIAETYRLPKIIKDFIPEHHGTMRIEYFYRKALAQQNAHESQILESDFRYPGPKPKTVETGILMLADGIEAACKSLERPSFRRIEAVVDKMIEARIEDGQLSECPLNFQDIFRIKDAFLNVLAGIYHVRIKYPGQEEPITQSEAITESSIEPNSSDPKTIEQALD